MQERMRAAVSVGNEKDRRIQEINQVVKRCFH
jgi:hypothetical protein